MKRRTIYALGVFILAALLMILLAFSLGNAPKKNAIAFQYPAIEHYGGIAERHDTQEVPVASQDYRVIFDVVSGTNDPRAINGGLDKVARAINVFAASGVPLQRLHLVAIIHAKATPSLLNDDTYQAWYDVKNPNTALIKALTDAGVKVVVCGQSLNHLQIKDEEVNPQVILAPSALTTLAIYGNRGYAYEQL
ncbi:DsrE family protein [Phytohalomonas tamaricis]|uniref:DsrE family protein n=1 Tax=Phytohalomonas tamaricis TaxID=2081032 RepID=UPI000D0B76E9|nr:DsrE family protein [Phytohalomonas tamaricis]